LITYPVTAATKIAKRRVVIRFMVIFISLQMEELEVDKFCVISTGSVVRN
jgi:hypothetical protein